MCRVPVQASGDWGTGIGHREVPSPGPLPNGAREVGVGPVVGRGKEAMVARASTRVWVGMAVSLAVTPLLVDWSGSIGRAQQSMSRAHLGVVQWPVVGSQVSGAVHMAPCAQPGTQTPPEQKSPAAQSEFCVQPPAQAVPLHV